MAKQNYKYDAKERHKWYNMPQNAAGKMFTQNFYSKQDLPIAKGFFQ